MAMDRTIGNLSEINATIRCGSSALQVTKDGTVLLSGRKDNLSFYTKYTL